MKAMYEMLPVGQENAIKLSELSEMWNVSDREVRRTIEEMIYNDMPVCNLRSGYFRPATITELKSYRDIIRSYSCKFKKKEYRLNKTLQRFGNMKMDL